MEIQNMVNDIVTRQQRRRAGRKGLTQTQALSCVPSLVESILSRAQQRVANGKSSDALVRMVRGLSAIQGITIDRETREADIAYTRALNTGTQPGSTLVPVIEANAIVEQLSLGSAARGSGATIWNMGHAMQEMTVPVGITAPSFVWMAQNSRQTPDANFNAGQILFDLKECWAFMLLPVQLFRAAVPMFSSLLETFFALGLAEAEDSAIFATSTIPSAPPALMQAPGVTLVSVGGSANGGNLAWSDVTGMLEKSATSKVRPPLAWYIAPRSLTRLLSLQDTSSRPLLVPTVTSGLDTQAHYELLGWPIFLTNGIPINQSLGSGSNQSSIILAPGSAFQIAQDVGIQMMISTDFAIDSAQIALRIGARRSFAYQPGASFTILQGVN